MEYLLPKTIKGFTLVELLVVISILGVLAVIGMSTYSAFQKRARDTQRQSNLKVIQSALEQYHADQGYYPATAIVGTTLRSPLNTKTYLNRIPADPLDSNSGYSHQYNYVASPLGCTNTGTSPVYCVSYCLYANLESSSDQTSACADDTTRNYEVTSP
ncbi:MAG: prepilin-type N-terminal cleavage/methylation domain-containing protein [Candidatus Daviesbacteria bacterium]